MRTSPSPLDEPLLSSDIVLCSRVHAHICQIHQIPVNSEQASRIGRIAVDLYRHGVRNEEHLKAMVDAAVGVNLGLPDE